MPSLCIVLHASCCKHITNLQLAQPRATLQQTCLCIIPCLLGWLDRSCFHIRMAEPGVWSCVICLRDKSPEEVSAGRPQACTNAHTTCTSAPFDTLMLSAAGVSGRLLSQVLSAVHLALDRHAA